MAHISWQAPEFETKEKSPGWFGGLGLLLLGLVVFAIVTGNYFFALLVPLIGFVAFRYAVKEPKMRAFAIDGQGVKIDAQHHSFDTLSSFWIFYEPPDLKELSLRSKHRFMPYIRIPLADQDPVEIRKALIDYLPERRHRQWLLDDLMRSVGF